MVVWLLLGCYCLTALCTYEMADRNRRAAPEIRAVFAKHGLSGAPLGCLIALAALAAAVLWTVYGVQVGDWRFIAIAWLPIIAGLMGRAATHRIEGSKDA